MKIRVLMRLRRTRGEKTVEIEIKLNDAGITKDSVNRYMKIIDSVSNRWTKED